MTNGTTHTNTLSSPNRSLKRESQFHIPWDPETENLDFILSLGYSHLNKAAKNTYYIISALTRMGEPHISLELITEIEDQTERSTWNALKALKAEELIKISENGHILLLEPNARDEHFRKILELLH
ncbi:MAG: hypothetical protein K9N29_03145 [Candidatus Marinimicrobia bacterium]|nr:hypothetical protein [Candidatus Neomarinimicrobiota bacterium]